VFVVAPLLTRLQVPPVVGMPAVTRLLRGDGGRAEALGATVRRVLRTRGATVRRAGRDAAEPPRLQLAARLDAIAGPPRARVDVGQLATLEVLGAAAASPVDLAWGLMRADAFTDAPPRPGFSVHGLSLAGTGGGLRPGAVLPGGVIGTLDPGLAPGRPIGPRPVRRARPRPDGPDGPPDPIDPPEPDPLPPRPPRRDSADAAAFRVLAARHVAAFVTTTSIDRPTTAALDIGAVFDQVIAMTAPAATFTAALERVLVDPATVPDPTNPEPAAPIPDRLAPRFGAPMASALAELGQEWLLPGLGDVPANTALALRTSSSFVQAFMIGLNHELGRELLWREFPTPLNATFFQRFWDSAIDPAAPVDLDPLADWGDRPLGTPTATGERFVLLLRTELLRRFPHALVTAVRGDETRLPVFSGALVPDVRFFGFAIPADEAALWSIVIAEQPGAPRFGFEVGEAPVGVSHAPAPDATSAALAHRLRQLPARITIPVPVLLRPQEPEADA
jgi:hypothetical protein